MAEKEKQTEETMHDRFSWAEEGDLEIKLPEKKEDKKGKEK